MILLNTTEKTYEAEVAKKASEGYKIKEEGEYQGRFGYKYVLFTK